MILPLPQSRGPAGLRGLSDYPASLRFRNTTTGNQGIFQVGDRFTVEVTGPPNSPVIFDGGANGARDHAVLGTTSASGVWSTSGQMSEYEIGNWVEDWSVGGVSVGRLSFRVVAAAQQQEQEQQQEEEKKTGAADKVQQIVVERGLPSTAELTEWAKDNLLLVAGGVAVLFLLLKGGR